MMAYGATPHVTFRAQQQPHQNQRRSAARKYAARARSAALVVVGPYTKQGHYIGERPLSFGARRGATCQLQLPIISWLSRGTRERDAELAVSREEAQHASMLRARAVPRWLWSVHELTKGTVPARGLSASARGRGVTCQLRLPIISWLSRGTRERTTALAVSQEEAQHSSLLYARAVPHWLWL